MGVFLHKGFHEGDRDHEVEGKMPKSYPKFEIFSKITYLFSGSIFQS